MNPLFAFYAAIGCFGIAHQLPRPLVRAGLPATAVTLAGSQSGGLPPGDGPGWALFGAVLLVNGPPVSLFAHFGDLTDRCPAGGAARHPTTRSSSTVRPSTVIVVSARWGVAGGDPWSSRPVSTRTS